MNNKFILGLLTGIAIGAAAVYLASEDSKDEILGDLKDLANKTKDKIASHLSNLETKVSDLTEEYGV